MNASATWAALGTTAAVVVTDGQALAAARAAVEAELRAIDAACSRFRADSELTRLNHAAGRPTRVSPLLAEALATALRAARLTRGAVDPTIGAAVIAAGYDRDFAALRAGAVDPTVGAAVIAAGYDRDSAALTAGGAADPTVAAGYDRDFAALRAGGAVDPAVDGYDRDFAAQRAVRVPGWRVVRLGSDGIVRLPAGVTLDLGATAKALAADRAARTAATAAGCGVLVSLGGDIAGAGPAPAGGWRVRVTDDHAAGEAAPGQTVALAGGGLATSSTTVRRWPGGHHIVDPATGAPAAAPWRTVSVAAATCVDANIAGTAAIVLGPEAPGWLAERRLPARLCAHDGTVVRVAGWPAEDTE